MPEHHNNTHGSISASIKKLRLGVKLFSLYFLGYAAFVWLSVATFGTANKTATLMGRRVFGMNVGVFSGFALIVMCIVMAYAYDFYCGVIERRDEEAKGLDV